MARSVKVVASTRKYDPDELDIVRNVPIDKLLERLDVEVITWRKSAGYVTACPFHPPDRSPSFAIQNQGDPQKIGRWNCFHGSAGDLFDFVSQLQEISRQDAKDLLVRWFKLYRIPAPDIDELRKRLAAKKPKVADELPRIPLPRTCDDIEPIVEYLTTNPTRMKMGYNRTDIERLIKRWGLRFADGGYYANRIIIPIWDKKGEQVYYQAQAIDMSLVEHLPAPQNKVKLYPAKSPTPYHIHNIHRITGDYVITVEGFWDMAALDYWGLPTIMAGQARITPAQVALLIEHFRRVFVWFDNDVKEERVNAGQVNAKKACRRLTTRSVKAWRVVGPAGVDPDELGSGAAARKILRNNSNLYQLKHAPTNDDLKRRLRI